MTDFHAIEYAVADRIATITLNRPDRRNGYTVAMAHELAAAFTAADLDDEVRCVVLTGAGKDFCVGADFTDNGFDLGIAPEADGSPWIEPAGRCALRIFDSRKPVIAAIRGAAVGAGSTIVLPADYRIASTDARFGFLFSRRGFVPEGASTWFLPRLVGTGAALDWMLSGRMIDAPEALAKGLVHSLAEPEEVLDRAYELAAELVATTAPVSAALIRQMVYRLSALPSPYDAQRVDSRLIANLPTDPDAIEGVMAFLQRRAPRFPGTVSKDLPDWLPWREPGSAWPSA
ncbi:enoyl-CoA hydratase-related protein [Nocardia inohanensis]|uniref:enoyl-CoA hydratase-related protein n=1 Tax=Nocardia inohanensis TaxID=209246 RepID=UPI00082AC67D|nr:enoyl-CoA hydratase-related protein [Nocardia inohanensis]